MSAQNLTSDNLRFSYYIVALIDVLNQKDTLAKIHRLPENEEDKAEFNTLLKATFGAIHKFRERMDTFLNSVGKSSDPTDLLPTDMYEKYCKPHIKRMAFSDTIIYYCSLVETESHNPLTSTQCLLIGLGSLLISTMPEKLVCRGGVDIGVGGEIFENEIYGPALYRAHRLETRLLIILEL